MHLPHGNGDVLATLGTVEGLLRQSPDKFEEREVYFLTDLQAATWVNVSSPRPSPEHFRKFRKNHGPFS